MDLSDLDQHTQDVKYSRSKEEKRGTRKLKGGAKTLLPQTERKPWNSSERGQWPAAPLIAPTGLCADSLDSGSSHHPARSRVESAGVRAAVLPARPGSGKTPPSRMSPDRLSIHVHRRDARSIPPATRTHSQPSRLEFIPSRTLGSAGGWPWGAWRLLPLELQPPISLRTDRQALPHRTRNGQPNIGPHPSPRSPHTPPSRACQEISSEQNSAIPSLSPRKDVGENAPPPLQPCPDNPGACTRQGLVAWVLRVSLPTDGGS